MALNRKNYFEYGPVGEAKRLSVRLPDWTYEGIQRIAGESRDSVSRVVQRALGEFVRNNPPPNAADDDDE